MSHKVLLVISFEVTDIDNTTDSIKFLSFNYDRRARRLHDAMV